MNFKADMNAKALQLANERNTFIQSTQKVIKLSSENHYEDMASKIDLSRLRAYQNEIKLTREQKDIEMRLRKQLTDKILSTWKELKELRNKQKFRNTEYKLIIKK